LKAARSEVFGETAAFQSDFAPPEKPDISKQVFFDILNTVFGLGSAFSWNKILKDIPAYKNTNNNNPEGPNNHGWHKDTLNSGFSNSMAFAKSARLTVENRLETREKIENATTQIFNTFDTMIHDQYTMYMSGSDEGIEQLDKQFRNGFWTDNKLDGHDFFTTTDDFVRLVHGQMIVPTWRLNTMVWPVIIMEDKADSTVNPETLNIMKRSVETAYNVTTPGDNMMTAAELAELAEQATASGTIIRDQEAASARVHYDSKTMWLLDGHICDNTDLMDHTPPRKRFCKVSALRALPGTDKLTQGTYRGIILEDIVVSAYEGYKANGNKNGYVVKPENINPEDDFPLTRTPGFFSNIPICDYKTFATNWNILNGASEGKVDPKCDDYPCCPGLAHPP
jgi:hypothetical protein